MSSEKQNFNSNFETELENGTPNTPFEKRGIYRPTGRIPIRDRGSNTRHVSMQISAFMRGAYNGHYHVRSALNCIALNS